MWDKTRGWDDPALPDHLLLAWKEWEADLQHLSRITIPRCYTPTSMDDPQVTHDVHIFSDASERAYRSVAYLRSVGPDGHINVAFLLARSRVAPRKQQSIPRLELCTALTGAQLAELLINELTLPIREIICWTDSTTVLHWLHSESCHFKVFVGTRVAEIQELTKAEVWRYVESHQNPADDLTRGKN